MVAQSAPNRKDPSHLQACRPTCRGEAGGFPLPCQLCQPALDLFPRQEAILDSLQRDARLKLPHVWLSDRTLDDLPGRARKMFCLRLYLASAPCRLDNKPAAEVPSYPTFTCRGVAVWVGRLHGQSERQGEGGATHSHCVARQFSLALDQIHAPTPNACA